MELEAYKDVLEFHPELQLTTEPLRIDCVVIKKTKEVEIKKNIGKIFRTWNILEYKSPDDYVAIKDFYKVYAYACLYASLNEVPITDITITFVESHYPRELLKHLKNDRRFTVAKTFPGVYNVTGDVIPIQIIDSRKLSAEDNVWLKNLSNKLNYSDIELISFKIAQQGKSAHIDAYAYAVIHAYLNKRMEEKIMTAGVKIDYAQALEDRFGHIFEKVGLTAKWKAEGEAKWQAVVAENDAKHKAEIEQLRAQIAELQKK